MHYARRQGGIDSVHDLLLLVDHSIQLPQLVSYGTFSASHKPPPQGGQHDAYQSNDQPRAQHDISA